MRKCAFLSMDNLQDFECYDHLLIEPMARAGWQVSEIPWRSKNVNWADYEVVIVRSTWDYQDDPDSFMVTLEQINRQTRLENSLDIVKWNIQKTYLIDLDLNGVNVVPTLWGENLTRGNLLPAYQRLQSKEIIIKPVISANADFTYRLNRKSLLEMESELINIFRNKSYMIQPFMSHIVHEGEFSLFYFEGRYSHCILKKPRDEDFRVQEEHGGVLKTVKPGTELLAAAEQTIRAIGQTPLYARVDFVRADRNDFALMELELIEPSLYFNMDEKSGQRFVDAFSERMAS